PDRRAGGDERRRAVGGGGRDDRLDLCGAAFPRLRPRARGAARGARAALDERGDPAPGGDRERADRVRLIREIAEKEAQSSIFSIMATKRLHGRSISIRPISGSTKGNAMPDKKSSQNKPAVADALNALLADSLTLYLKTKNYHWHVEGPRF